MAKSVPSTKFNPQRSSPGGAFIMHLIGREKRQALSITWPRIPEPPRTVRLRIRPQPRPRWEKPQPVAFCKFEINN